ncbi:MAG: hypothetical protein JO161_01775 [Planctomycetaceae bacterium]|nr:hypothetical protein [Planctomycetaceae bacterium]
MTHTDKTEASCLLETGALYHNRIGLVAPTGASEMVFAGFKKGAFSLYFGDAPIYHFDLEGRWQRAFLEPTHYLKSLDTSVYAIDRTREDGSMVMRRRALEEHEIENLDLSVRDVALKLSRELDAGRLERRNPPAGKAQALSDDGLRAILERIAGWDAAAWHRHRQNYRSVYGPLPFLPPDCQNAVVLQATEGEANGVSFGCRDPATPFYRSPAALEDHALKVARLMGRRLLQNRIAFLTGGDLLDRPDDLLKYLEILSRVFAIADGSSKKKSASDDLTPQLEGIHIFQDIFPVAGLHLDALRAYRERHLIHVSLGVESGDQRVRNLFRNTGSNADLHSLVSNLKAAEIRVSLLFLVGAGGVDLADTHVEKTSQLLGSLEIGRGDAVFLLDERELDDLSPSDPATGSLTHSAWEQQLDRFQEALAPLRGRSVKVLPYSLVKQWT